MTTFQTPRCRRFSVAFALIAFSWALNTEADCGLAAEQLRVEYHDNPMGIDTARPRLSWIVTSGVRGARQTGYRIIAASSPDKLHQNQGDLWDSDRVNSDETVSIEYGGRALGSNEQVFWKVKVWDQDGSACAWSDKAHWSTGLLNQWDWQGTWIGLNTDHFVGDPYEDLHLPPATYLRTEFQLEKQVVRATLFATARGLYQAHINGERVGEDVFTPGYTDYRKRILYQAYDVTDQLVEGANALGLTVADGWYAGYVMGAYANKRERVRGFYGDHTSIRAHLEVEFADGERRVFASSPQGWTGATGPIREADIIMGETYDARLEMPGWDRAGFDDSNWSPVLRRADNYGELQAYPGQLARVVEKIPAVSVTPRPDGTHIYDFGKNFAGVVELTVSGKRGDKVTLRFGEMLHPDGSLMTENLRGARATDTYVLSGNGQEVWSPQFTYHGFQYVEVSIAAAEPIQHSLLGLRINADTPETGSIKIRNDVDWGGQRGLVTQLFENIKTTQFANFIEIPTDCPQRDERAGWTGDAQAFARTASYVADVAAFYTKWLQDLDDAQIRTGAYPIFAPLTVAVGREYAPGWSDAGIIVPYEVYTAYGDTRIIERMWQGMVKYMDFLEATAGPDHLLPGSGFGDWLTPGTPTSKDLIASAYYAFDAKLMAEMAAAIGKTDDAARYDTLFQSARDAFLREYVDDRGRIAAYSSDDGESGETQTAYALALYMDLVRGEQRQAAAGRLAALVEANEGLLDTGFLGVRPLLPMLSEFGYDDVAYRLLTNTRYPSWGYNVVNGATSIWERWDSYTKENGFQTTRMNSFSHYTYGSVAEWMFEYMGGISATSPGFRTIRIRPSIHAPFEGVTTTFNSIRGTISTDWHMEGDDLLLRVVIPANTTATIRVPVRNGATVLESNTPAARAPGVSLVSRTESAVTYRVVSGHYAFRSTDYAL